MATVEHPLVLSLREAGELDPYLGMPVANADDTGWSPAGDLFQTGDANLRETGDGLRVREMGDYQQSCCSLGLHHRLPNSLYLSDGRPVCAEEEGPQGDPGKPGLSSNRRPNRRHRTQLQPQFAVLPDDPAAGHPDAEVLHGESELYQRLKEWAFEANVEIVIAVLRRSVPASVKVSRNAVAASCGQALHRLYNLVEDKSPVIRAAGTLFGDPSSPIYGQVSMEVIDHEGKSGFFARRAGCCLVWRTREDNGYCSNCILQPREEQTRQFKNMLERVGRR